MRIRILRAPRVAAVDGIDLRRFLRGRQYDVGTLVAALFLSEGWAVPVPDDEPAAMICDADTDALGAFDRRAKN